MTDEAGPSKKPGILRAEVGKRTSTTSVEFKENIIEPNSPEPSIDKFSVSFANDNKQYQEQKISKDYTPGNIVLGDEAADEYSASANVILEMGRGDSWKRRSSRRRRRSCSPLSTPARRSSVFTTSSAETGISIEEDNQEEIFLNVRIHKEVVTYVKYQPWAIQKKLRLVQEAKSYIKQHEGQIQERLATSRTARDILAHINILLINHWNYTRRELGNLANSMIPWEPRIKEIESHFGTVVASYFTFLRWLFSVNVISAVVLVVLLAVPEVLFGNKEFSEERKKIPAEERSKAMNFLTLWNFEGVLKCSPMFYGYYNSENVKNHIFGNKLPLIYFMVSLGVYAYSFVAILRKMVVNSRQSKLSEKDDDCIFTWKMFTSWDYMIGNPETANNRTSSIILGFKEALLEEAERTREEKRNWKLLSIRIFTHFNVIWLLLSSMYAVIKVVERSEYLNLQGAKGWLLQNEVTVVITLIGTVYPIFFDVISYLEKYHPRKALRLQLARIMVLNLLNLYSFIFATFSMIHGKSTRLTELKERLTKIIKNNSKTNPKTATIAIKPSFPSVVTESLTVATLIIANFTTNSGTNMNFTGEGYNLNNYSAYSEDRNTLPSLQQFNSTLGHLSIDNSTEIYPQNILKPIHAAYTFSNTEEILNSKNTTPITVPLQTLPPANQTCTFNCTTQGKDSEIYSSSNPGNETSQARSTEISPKNLNLEKSSAFAPTASYNSGGTSENPHKETYTGTEISSKEPEETNNANQKVIKIAEKCTTELDSPRRDLSLHTKDLDSKSRKELHNLCWETMFGQELVKLTVMDLLMTVLGIIMGDFARALFVRYMNRVWCWDLEKKFPQYADFKMAENILHLVNNQGMVWMGMFFSPGLPLINVLKLAVMMYLRSWAVLTSNIPHEVVFRASRSNNFYFALLLTMLFLCVLPVGYALVWIEPSWHCGPFSNYNKIYHLFTYSLKKLIPGKTFNRVLDYIASPGIVIPLLMLLTLIIFYLLSLTSALREANDDLKIQLRRERTEERRKMFQIANRKRRGTEFIDSPFNKLYKIINRNSLRNISSDNAVNNIQDERIPMKSIAKHTEENQQGENKKSTKADRGQANKCDKNEKKLPHNKNVKDSMSEPKSLDDIPLINICKTESMEHVLDGRVQPKISSRNGKDTTSPVGETCDESNDDVFIENKMKN